MEDKKKESNVAYFAGGCFWAPERFFRFINGVTKFELGYATCGVKHAGCKKVIDGKNNFVETVKVTFDPNKISFDLLLDLFFRIIDPPIETQDNDDSYSSSHTGIFYTSEDELSTVSLLLEQVAKRYENRLAVEAIPLGAFYNAEDYKRDFMDENGGGYCAH